MSTSYYRLRPPVTSIQITVMSYHLLTVFEGDINAGTLTLSKEAASRIALGLADTDERPAPLRTHWGGIHVGAVVTVHDATLPDDAVVVSEYGGVLTVAAVKRRAGAGRHASTLAAIGELFGYKP